MSEERVRQSESVCCGDGSGRKEEDRIQRDWCGMSSYLEDPVEVEPESCEALGEARDEDTSR